MELQLITGIEVRYFRSIYRVKLSGIKDLTVLSGKNDVGKSNVLKALNLFFNNETDWQTPLDFDRDFNRQRLDEVRQSTKGKQFISVRLTFNRGNRCPRSLPEQFSVTRRWYRDSRQPEQSDDVERRIQGTGIRLAVARRSLSYFLNLVKLHYIPAVKDVSVQEALFREIQEALFSGRYQTQRLSLEDTNEAITQELQDLYDDFQRATAIETVVTLPDTLPELHKAFRVDTSLSGGHPIPLELRGDGIRSRYIPSILDFVTKRQLGVHVWAVEEPETSLEYARVMETARAFRELYAQQAQILVTTHAAPFLQHSDNTAIFRTLLRDKGTELQPVPLAGQVSLEDTNDIELFQELGLVELQRETHEKLQKRIQQFNDEIDSLKSVRRELEDSMRPVLITEGPTDETILKQAWAKLEPTEPCPWDVHGSGLVVDGGSHAGADVLRLVLEHTLPGARIVVGLFDRDEQGIKIFKGLRHFEETEDPDIKAHKNGRAFAILWPVPPGKEWYAKLDNMPIEFVFADQYILDAINSGYLDIEYVPLRTTHRNSVVSEKIVRKLYYSKVKATTKRRFAEQYIPTLPVEAFKPFCTLFDKVRWCVSRSTQRDGS